MSTTDPRAEARDEPRAEEPSGAPERLDREISLRGLTLFTVVLALLMVVAAVLMWGLSDYLTSSLEARDPAPPVLPAARQQWELPEPRLQTSPEQDLEAMEREEEEYLGSYAWVDEAGGVARVPIERALELVAEHGLPAAAPATAGPGAAAPADGGADPDDGGAADGGAEGAASGADEPAEGR